MHLVLTGANTLALGTNGGRGRPSTTIRLHVESLKKKKKTRNRTGGGGGGNAAARGGHPANARGLGGTNGASKHPGTESVRRRSLRY